MTRPLCRDCHWYWQPFMPSMQGPYSHCARPISEERSLVSGNLVHTLRASAESERKAGRTWFGLGRERCGPDAQFFETRPKPPPPIGGSGGSK